MDERTDSPSVSLSGDRPGPTKSPLENILSGWAVAFLTISLIAAFVALIASGTSDYGMWGEDGLSVEWIGIALTSCFQGVFVYLMLRTGADVIRLLKRLNGLSFGGEIRTRTAQIESGVDDRIAALHKRIGELAVENQNLANLVSHYQRPRD